MNPVWNKPLDLAGVDVSIYIFICHIVVTNTGYRPYLLKHPRSPEKNSSANWNFTRMHGFLHGISSSMLSSRVKVSILLERFFFLNSSFLGRYAAYPINILYRRFNFYLTGALVRARVRRIGRARSSYLCPLSRRH